MKNKKLLYGLLGVGAIAGLYFWSKNEKSKEKRQKELLKAYSVVKK